MESPHKPQKPTCVCVCVCVFMYIYNIKYLKKKNNLHYTVYVL